MRNKARWFIRFLLISAWIVIQVMLYKLTVEFMDLEISLIGFFIDVAVTCALGLGFELTSPEVF